MSIGYTYRTIASIPSAVLEQTWVSVAWFLVDLFVAEADRILWFNPVEGVCYVR
jgi:hypothetical protein